MPQHPDRRAPAGIGVMTLPRMRRATPDLGGEAGGLGAWVFWNGTWLRRPRFGAVRLINRDKSFWRAYGTMMDSGAGLKEGNHREEDWESTDMDGKPCGTSSAGLLN